MRTTKIQLADEMRKSVLETNQDGGDHSEGVEMEGNRPGPGVETGFAGRCVGHFRKPFAVFTFYKKRTSTALFNVFDLHDP